ncbi:MAG: hypothetical protein GY799_18915 [Desulfobulbaceae bacterium]|nr:hypothetical protein [Desulfobulbaceae bacterium]
MLNLDKLPHMDIVDMPSDPNGYLGKFRMTLRGAYNSNRGNANAIKLIKDTLEYAVGILQAAEEEVAPAQSCLPTPEVPQAPEKPASSQRKKANPSTRAAKR